MEQIPPAQRRVLVLRAGVGSGAALSRVGTARRLGLSRERVMRLERRGLRRLTHLGRAAACGAAGASVASGTPVAPLAGSPLDPTAPTTLGGTSLASAPAARGAVKGVSAHGAGAQPDGPSVPLPPDAPGRVLIGLAFAVGLLVLVLLVRRELLRR